MFTEVFGVATAGAVSYQDTYSGSDRPLNLLYMVANSSTPRERQVLKMVMSVLNELIDKADGSTLAPGDFAAALADKFLPAYPPVGGERSVPLIQIRYAERLIPFIDVLSVDGTTSAAPSSPTAYSPVVDGGTPRDKTSSRGDLAKAILSIGQTIREGGTADKK